MLNTLFHFIVQSIVRSMLTSMRSIVSIYFMYIVIARASMARRTSLFSQDFAVRIVRVVFGISSHLINRDRAMHVVVHMFMQAMLPLIIVRVDVGTAVLVELRRSVTRCEQVFCTWL